MVHQLWTTAATIVFDPIINQSIETDKQTILREKLFTLSRDNTQQRSLTLSCISSNNVETKFLACVKLYSIKKKINHKRNKSKKKKETQTDQVVTTSTTDGLLMVYWKYNMVTVHTHTHKHTKLALLNVWEWFESRETKNQQVTW